MADIFENLSSGLDSPASRHFAITPANTDFAIQPRALYVEAGGSVIVRDNGNVDVTYTVIAGQILPIRARQVRTGTTATVVGWY